MRLSSRARHAVRLTLEVHRLGDGVRPVRLSEVAKATNVSKSFLEQLAMALKSHSILRGICGRRGGYILGRDADEITIGDVLRAVTGPIDLVAEEPNNTVASDRGECRLVWLLLQQRVNQLLDGYTIADISDEASLDSIRDMINMNERHGEETRRVSQG